MAEIFVDEGLDVILNSTFNSTSGCLPCGLFVGLFSSQTSSTVPARGATGGSVPSGWQEVWATTGNYYRQQVYPSGWGSISTNGSGRQKSGTQVTFTGFTNSGSPANGYFLSTGSSSTINTKLIGFANFDSGVARTLATTSDQLLVTPTVQMDG